jgi:hypothetical protein
VIQVIKLATGEDILCEYVEKDDRAILTNPLRIMITPEGKLMAMQFSFFTEDNKFNLNINSVLCVNDPTEQLINIYNSKFGGLVTAPKGLVL